MAWHGDTTGGGQTALAGCNCIYKQKRRTVNSYREHAISTDNVANAFINLPNTQGFRLLDSTHDRISHNGDDEQLITAGDQELKERKQLTNCTGEPKANYQR